MNQPLKNTFAMFRSLLRRDWVKLIVWLLAVLAFAASGAGKFELALTPATKGTMYTMFQNPAMIGLFGPTKSTAATFNVGAIMGQSTTLMTALVFSIVSIIYVINRTRKEEDDGVAEIFRSFQIGKLANTTAVVMELFILHVVMTFLLAASIQAQNISTLNNFSSNLLFSAAVASQGFLWGIVALVFAQLFPEAGSAKGATFGIFGLLYIIRMGTDISNINLSWLNPMSWSYLTNVYVQDDWKPIILVIVLSVLLLSVEYALEIKRDVNAGYMPQGRGKLHAKKSLLSFPGLTLRLLRNSLIGWILGIFVLGATYGSMFGQMDKFINSNATLKQIFAIQIGMGKDAIINQFMSTLFAIISIIVTCFAVVLLTRMVSEERKNRQEQLYATALSRTKLYFTYVLIAAVGAVVAQFAAVVGIYAAQADNRNALSFADVAKPGMVWIFGILFVLGLLALLIAFFPRFTAVIWVYVGFAFFMSYLGNIIKFPDWVHTIDVFYHIPKLPVDKMNWGNVSLILVLTVIFVLVGLIGYRKRDLIGG